MQDTVITYLELKAKSKPGIKLLVQIKSTPFMNLSTIFKIILSLVPSYTFTKYPDAMCSNMFNLVSTKKQFYSWQI